MSDLSILVEQGALDNPGEEIYAIFYLGEKLWVKEARKTGSNLLHKFAYQWIKNPLLTPVATKSKIESVQYESSKLKRLHALFLPVPKVITVTNNYFVLEDCGPIIHDLLHQKKLKDPNTIFDQVIVALSKLHNCGEFHGATQLKNLTYTQGKVHFIDFEESFDAKIPLDQLQFRDLFLFLFSLSKEKADCNYIMLIERYITLSGKKSTKKKFKKLLSQVSALMKIIENKTIWKYLDTDTKSVYHLLQSIKKYVE